MAHSELQTALQCLSAVARHHRIDLSVDKLRHEHTAAETRADPALVIRMAREAGLKAKADELSWEAIVSLRGAYPVLAQLKNGNWIVVVGPAGTAGKADAIAVVDPLAERAGTLVVSREQFRDRWNGTVVFVKRSFRLTDADQPFGFLWFVPELIRQRTLLRDVAIAALVLHVLGFATPLFFQIMVDKVLVHESYATLSVLSVGIVVALLFDSVFTYLRRYLLLFASNKIDVRVGTRTFQHLLRLPLDYFERRSAGVIVKHMQQSERIREFLTGRLFLTLLDALSLLVFLPLLLWYSTKLTLVVLGFALMIALLVAVMVGPYKRRLKALYEAEALRQGLIVETVHGMRTVKSLAIEPVQRRSWDEQLAHVVQLRFEVEKISTTAQAITGLIEKLMTVAIICLGTIDVFAGTMTVGALIAFNMLASRVSSPLVQITNMIHEYQDMALSVRMLGEVMNNRPEQQASIGGLSPTLKGRIEFENVTFRYSPEAPPSLEEVSFHIPQGSIVGIVGRSGSGKTTITRLIHGIHHVQQGLIRIDGVDVRELNLAHLRRSIGIVLQDNFLFRGTIRDNIAMTLPSAGFDRIVAAAALAGADEFIERLPKGFNTFIEENGANLSGGQRQRIAIARALLTNPRILIFDEATSSLDPESEAIIRTNLSKIAEGRTVIIVSHRLSSLTDAHSIIVLDRGRVADIARHEQLIPRCAAYRQLWNQQHRHSA